MHLFEELEFGDIATQRPKEIKVYKEAGKFDHRVNEFWFVIVILKLKLKSEIKICFLVVVGVVLTALRWIINCRLTTVIRLAISFLIAI